MVLEGRKKWQRHAMAVSDVVPDSVTPRKSPTPPSTGLLVFAPVRSMRAFGDHRYLHTMSDSSMFTVCSSEQTSDVLRCAESPKKCEAKKL